MYKNIFIDRPSEGSSTVYIFDDKKGVVTLPASQFNYAYVPDRNGAYVSMTGVRVAKKNRVKDAKVTFEADVPIETRVLTDLYLNEDEPSVGNTVLYFDIEVSMENGIPDIKNPNNEVTAIAAYDSGAQEYKMFVLNKTGLSIVQKDGVVLELFDNEINLLTAFLDYYEEVSPSIITGWNSDQFDVPYLYNRIKQQCGPGIANKLSPIGKVKYSDFRERYVIAGVSSLDYLDLYKKFTYTRQPNYRLGSIGMTELGEGKVEYEGTLDDLFKNDPEKFIEYNLQDVKIVVKLDEKLKLIELIRGMCHVGHVCYEDYAMSSRILEGTMLTYLHRKKVIATNKPVGGRELYNAQRESDEDGFSGAFVKAPMPSLYEWVYSLDLQSLYPSIIRSLNISPETKVGNVGNWNLAQYEAGTIDDFVVNEYPGTTNESITHLTRSQFDAYMKETGYTISSNGILYSTDKTGIIPEILSKWFAERIEFQTLMREAAEKGDTELSGFYDRRQHIQKILLNSVYGVLGLPIFRFYDVDNALAVTATGQDVIKYSAEYVNSLYDRKGVAKKTDIWCNKYWDICKEDAKRQNLPTPPYPSNTDHCIYIDTDSIYFTSGPFIGNLITDDEKKEFTIKLAKLIESTLNKYYNELAPRLFFCNAHKLFIKGESIVKAGLWIAKKRYALDKIYNLEKNKDVVKESDRFIPKGLDLVRSSFPTAFRIYMKELLLKILRKEPKEEVDVSILQFRDGMKMQPFRDIARNTAVNNISDYEDTTVKTVNSFKRGTPQAVKAAITYNKLIKLWKLEKNFERIKDGAKIKYVILKENPLNIEVLAIKGYNDPPQIINFIEEHTDYKAMFDNELASKLEDFYGALGWGNIPTNVNQFADRFFSF